MRRRFDWILIVPVVALVEACAGGDGPAASSCRADDWECWKSVAMQSPVRHMPYWRSAFEKPVEQRLGPAPQELVEYLRQDNIRQGIPNRPRSAAIPPDFLKDVSDAVAEMPPSAMRSVDKKLAGIYFLHHLGGTG